MYNTRGLCLWRLTTTSGPVEAILLSEELVLPITSSPGCVLKSGLAAEWLALGLAHAVGAGFGEMPIMSSKRVGGSASVSELHGPGRGVSGQLTRANTNDLLLYLRLYRTVLDSRRRRRSRQIVCNVPLGALIWNRFVHDLLFIRFNFFPLERR